MKSWIVLALGAAVLASTPASAQKAPPTPAAAPAPVTIEYYYRIKWGSGPEFIRLYNKNHAPLLAEMQKAGFIKSIVVEEPYTHMAGGVRWDLRVTIVFRDAAAAISDPEWDHQWAEATKRLFPDEKAFYAEEDRRFTMLEDHWDVIVTARKD
jgi:hypothetical protein